MAFSWENAKIKLRQYVSILNSPDFDASNIEWLTLF